MKLSHAASRLRTAIAELRRAIGVGSGALLGVMVNLPKSKNCGWFLFRGISNSARERSEHPLQDNSIPNHPALSSSATLYHSRQRTQHRKVPSSSCGDTSRSPHQRCNHPENGAGDSVHPKNSATAKSSDAASQSTKHKKPISRRQLLLILGLGVYLPVAPLTWIANTSIPAPIWLLLATQGWLTATLCLLPLAYINETRMTPNARTHTRRTNQREPRSGTETAIRRCVQ